MHKLNSTKPRDILNVCIEFWFLLSVSSECASFCTKFCENVFTGRPKAALLFWFFRDFRCGVSLLIVILVIYKYKNR